MRLIILLILCNITINGLTAQGNDLALLDEALVTSRKLTPKPESLFTSKKNATYLLATRGSSSSIVNKWKSKIASYNLKDNSVYDDSEKSTYLLKFKNKQVNITVIYNSDGEINSSYETYTNVKIPNALRKEIYSTYKQCKLLNTTYHTGYRKNAGTTKEYYKVTIEVNHKKLSLKFDKSFNAI